AFGVAAQQGVVDSVPVPDAVARTLLERWVPGAGIGRDGKIEFRILVDTTVAAGGGGAADERDRGEGGDAEGDESRRGPHRNTSHNYSFVICPILRARDVGGDR